MGYENFYNFINYLQDYIQNVIKEELVFKNDAPSKTHTAFKLIVSATKM